MSWLPHEPKEGRRVQGPHLPAFVWIWDRDACSASAPSKTPTGLAARRSDAAGALGKWKPSLRLSFPRGSLSGPRCLHASRPHTHTRPAMLKGYRARASVAYKVRASITSWGSRPRRLYALSALIAFSISTGASSPPALTFSSASYILLTSDFIAAVRSDT